MEVAQVCQALVMRLRTFFQRTGAAGFLVGMSGGLDSSVVCALAVEAVGAEHVKGVLLPSEYTSQESVTLAEQLCDALGVEQRTIPVDSVRKALNTVLEQYAPAHTEQQAMQAQAVQDNVQARVRGLVMMTLSNRSGYLVLNTTNKSEIAVGYTTLYGDSCGAVAVLGSLYKTEVYALANHLNATMGNPIPELVITRPPTAELHPGQSDTDSLPPYAELDEILQALGEEAEYAYDKERLASVYTHYGKNKVESVVRLVQGNLFKRAQLPPVL